MRLSLAALPLAALATMLLMPAPARAATVGLEGTELVYRGGPGEVDDFVAQPGDPSEVPARLWFTVRGGPITAGPGCERRGGSPVCSLAGVTAIRVLAGDGDDRPWVLSDIPVAIDLGPGDDDFRGRASVLTLTAGEGNDLVDAETGGGTLDLGPGDDRAPVSTASVYAGPLHVEGGDGDDTIDLSGHAERGISLSGGAGDDAIVEDLYEAAPGIDVACGPGADRTRLRQSDRTGDGCAARANVASPRSVSLDFREGGVTGPATVSVTLRRRPGNGRRPAELLARGRRTTRAAGPLRIRLKTTAAGRRWGHDDLKVYVVIRTRTGGDSTEVRFDSRLT